MIPKDGITPRYLLDALRRRFWYVVIPFFLVILVTVIHCIKAPKIYRSSALILVQPQEVPTDYVQPTVTTNVKSRLSSITDEIMSRSRLQDIIIKHDLYPEILKSASMQQAVEEFRQNIRIDFAGNENKGRLTSLTTSFGISFEGKRPIQVKEVTAELTQLYIDYNYRLRAEQAAGTTEFLERELGRMKEVLRQKEEAVRDFKQKYVGLLPEQMENNYRIMTQLQQHLDSINIALQKTEDRKVLLQAQLSKLENLKGSTVAAGGQRGERVTLEELRRELQTLQSRYSDRHPDVIRLKARIAKFENGEHVISSESKSTKSGNHTSPVSPERLLDLQQEDQSAELTLIGKEIFSLRKEKDRTQAQIEEYRQRIESGPRIEQLSVDMNRDYEQANQNYQSLLKKKLQAELAENLERTQKGEQFKILDAANLPVKPYKPNIPRLLAMGFVLALGCSFGLAFLREYVDPTFWSRKELESVLELPVLASIPIIQTERDRRRKKLKLAATLCALLAMSSTLLYALYILWRRNPKFLPLPFL